MTPTPDQLNALLRLWKMATEHSHGNARICANVLLGCYNGPRFRFDLTELRRLDAPVRLDVLAVLAMDSDAQSDAHKLLGHALGLSQMGSRFELLACDWSVKGKCDKADEACLRNSVARVDNEAALLHAQQAPLPTQSQAARIDPLAWQGQGLAPARWRGPDGSTVYRDYRACFD